MKQETQIREGGPCYLRAAERNTFREVRQALGHELQCELLIYRGSFGASVAIAPPPNWLSYRLT